jgi:hypothetical protein
MNIIKVNGKPAVIYKGKIAAKSKAAILFLIVPNGQQYEVIGGSKESDNQYNKVWFPLSHIHQIIEQFSPINNTLDTLVVTEWIAKQKGLV